MPAKAAMSSIILIRHLSNSSLAGQSREFEQAEIRIGRRPENDIVFNPELDRTVSGHHCRIVADQGDLYVVDQGSTNGTFVNGQRVQERTRVTHRDRIVLGERGPELAVSLKSAEVASPSTIMGNVGQMTGRGMAGTMGLLDAGVDLPASAPVAATIPPIAVTPPLLLQRPPVDDAISPLTVGPVTPQHLYRPPSRLSQGQKISIGMNTLMAELSKATSRERRRIYVIGLPIVLLLLSGMGAAWYFTRNGQPQVILQPAAPAGPPMTLPVLPQEWSAVLTPRKSAIYLIVMQRPGKEDRGIGTAWSVQKGALATNAHVGQEFLDKDPDVTLIARSNTNPPVDLKIVGATLHPGYVTFDKLTKSHPPVDVETGKPVTLAMPFDAALFQIDPADHEKQAPPLELADDATLASVVETTELAYIGFPMEASVESGVNVKAPVAHQFLGNLTRKTDIFLAGTSEARANFFQYTLVVQGGASGSPVFNRGGKVVGLISGNDHFFSSGGRIAITGKSFGPRVDAIRDLLDKTAETNTAPYAAEWRMHFRRIYDKALAAGKYDERRFQPGFNAFEVFGIIRASAAGTAGSKPPFKPTTGERTKTWNIELKGVGDAKGTTITSVPMTEEGVYCVVVWTDNPDVLPKVTIPAVESMYEQAPPVALKIFREKLGQGTPFVSSWAVPREVGDTLQFRISGIENGPTRTARFTAVLLKATP